MEYQYLIFEKKNGIAYLTLNRPEALNALNHRFKEELEDAIGRLEQDEEIRGAILTGTGKAFSTGTDIADFPDTVEKARRITRWSQDIYNRLEELEKPTIAAVNGYAVGGGFELALCCDIRVASERAKFGFPEVKLCAIPCYGGTQRLPRLCGAGYAKELIFTGDMVKADEAMAHNIVNRVVPAGEELAAAEEIMNKILKNAPLAVSYAKKCIDGGLDMGLRSGLAMEQELVAMLVATEDMQEGTKAFLEKRPPVFRNC